VRALVRSARRRQLCSVDPALRRLCSFDPSSTLAPLTPCSAPSSSIRARRGFNPRSIPFSSTRAQRQLCSFFDPSRSFDPALCSILFDPSSTWLRPLRLKIDARPPPSSRPSTTPGRPSQNRPSVTPDPDQKLGPSVDPAQRFGSGPPAAPDPARLCCPGPDLAQQPVRPGFPAPVQIHIKPRLRHGGYSTPAGPAVGAAGSLAAAVAVGAPIGIAAGRPTFSSSQPTRAPPLASTWASPSPWTLSLPLAPPQALLRAPLALRPLQPSLAPPHAPLLAPSPNRP
jgi:hypothetical protein